MRILVVEDERVLALKIERALARTGHEVSRAETGPDAVRTAMDHHFDLVLLDVNLPGFTGFEVLRQLREAAVESRVMMLTAQGEVEDRVAGLTGGADDYLTKPFAMEELLARVEALARRGGAVETSTFLEVGVLGMDVTKRRVTVRGERIALSPREFEVLQILMQEPGRAFSREEICERVWEREHEYDTRTVEIFVMRLRKKLDLDGSGVMIETVRGVGYALRSSE
ncbi:MAG: response regulator transcription factor [Verrucomicrobia bacterium]|nr:response regulator transcription factor [Verrucomicrobiota bacterium]MDA1006378.1 response regulator transcription factor [Verrucomicrobiota bacterium]